MTFLQNSVTQESEDKTKQKLLSVFNTENKRMVIRGHLKS